MQIVTKATLTLAALAVSGCGGSGGGGGLGGGGLPGSSFGEVFRAEPSRSLLIDPKAVDYALRGDTSEHTASNTQGATGVIATATMFDATPVLRDVFMTLNTDRTQLTIQVQGWAPIVLAVNGSATEYTGSYGEFLGQTISLSHFNDMGRTQYSDSRDPFSTTIGVGHYGLETPLDRVPTVSTATYDGAFDALAYVSSFSSPTGVGANGTFNMVLNFDGSSLSGTTAGSVFYTDGASTLQEDIATGTVSGVIAGNGIGGTFTLAGPNSSASLIFEGNMYGWDHEEIGGALIGTITGGGGTNPVYGEFDGQLD